MSVAFIGDYSRYYYIYLIMTKNKVIDAFKIYKVEIENQL